LSNTPVFFTADPEYGAYVSRHNKLYSFSRFTKDFAQKQGILALCDRLLPLGYGIMD